MFLFDMTAKLFWTVVGGSIGVLGIIGVLLVLGSIYACVMKWADDNEKDYNNPAWSLILKMHGRYRIKDVPITIDFDQKYWKGSSHSKAYEGCSCKNLARNDVEDIGACVNGDLCLKVLFIVFVVPIVILFALWIYPVTLTALTLLALAHLLRFCKRLSKKFTKHTVDPDAHKEEAG